MADHRDTLSKSPPYTETTASVTKHDRGVEFGWPCKMHLLSIDDEPGFYNTTTEQQAFSSSVPNAELRLYPWTKLQNDPMSRGDISGLVDYCINEDPGRQTVFTYRQMQPKIQTNSHDTFVIKVGTHVRQSEAENLSALVGHDLPVPVPLTFSPMTAL